MAFIGRERERQLLDRIVNSKEAAFVAVYGRRRVGKTYLIQQSLSKKGVYLECTGVKDGPLKDQLINFGQSFAELFYPGLALEPPRSWKQAFESLTQEIKKVPKNKKIVVFFDELPWLASRRSKLLQNLDYFWNTRWSKIPNFKLVVCGSAASWILKNLINAKGGFYNRITKIILLEPFNLSETRAFLKTKKIKLDEKQILDLYMVMGGIPYYLNQLESSRSIVQNVNEICFKKDGLLYSEFTRLFQSLFEKSETNLQIVKEIAKHHYGTSSSVLLSKMKKKAGGRFNERLRELEACGFIKKFLPYGRSQRDRYYKVIDEYTLFYLKWIQPIVEGQIDPRETNYWQRLVKSAAWYSWAGFSFETVCYKHINTIIKALGLGGVGCFVSHWQYQVPEARLDHTGAQVDLLLDREDGAITLCEIKYSAEPFVIDKTTAKNLDNKIETFKKNIGARKQIFLALITVMGLKKNLWSEELVTHAVVLNDLFV